MNRTGFAVALLLWAPPAGAGEADGPQVERAVIALYVEEREPVGADSSFADDVAELACFSQITGIEDLAQIDHVWIHGSREYARIRLTVRGPGWRTWSTKRILPGWIGDWKVEIRDADGRVLATVPFEIRPAAAPGDSAGVG